MDPPADKPPLQILFPLVYLFKDCIIAAVPTGCRVPDSSYSLIRLIKGEARTRFLGRIRVYSAGGRRIFARCARRIFSPPVDRESVSGEDPREEGISETERFSKAGGQGSMVI